VDLLNKHWIRPMKLANEVDMWTGREVQQKVLNDVPPPFRLHLVHNEKITLSNRFFGINTSIHLFGAGSKILLCTSRGEICGEKNENSRDSNNVVSST